MSARQRSATKVIWCINARLGLKFMSHRRTDRQMDGPTKLGNLLAASTNEKPDADE